MLSADQLKVAVDLVGKEERMLNSLISKIKNPKPQKQTAKG
jgi:hypothetical protein